MNIMTSEQPMSKFDHFNGVSSLINFISLQALAYEACDHTRMPLHMPKTLETCKKRHLVWLKVLRGVRQITRLRQHFFKYLTRKSCIFISYFIDSVVKIVLYLHFLYTKDNRLWQIKKKHEWWNNHFSDVFTYCLNLKHFASLFFLMQKVKTLFFSFNLSY